MVGWWHKMRKALAWFAVSSRVKFRKSGSGGGAPNSRSASGLLKLQDEVQMCGYRDVEVMWNMFIESNPEQMALATSTSKPTRKQSQRPPSFRSFHWCHNSTTTTTTASFTSFNQVLITTAEKCTETIEG